MRQPTRHGLRRRFGGGEIRLGDVERRTILRARRDLQTGRSGLPHPDSRQDALRRYVGLRQRRTPEAARMLLAAGFTAAERRVIDAMIGALPPAEPTAAPTTGRLVCAALILVPILGAIGAYSWASAYLEDRLIAIVLSGIALLLVMPVIGAAISDAPRSRAGR